VTERDSTTVDVDLVIGDVEELLVGKRDDGESLVELIEINLGSINTSSLKSLGNSLSGSSSEPDGVLLVVSIAEDTADNIELVLLGVLARAEDKGGSAIGDDGGVGGGDGQSSSGVQGVLEDRLEGGNLVESNLKREK